MTRHEKIAAVAPQVSEVANLAGELMAPASLLAFVFAVWSLAADLGMAGQFAFTHGVLSHWMVWLAIGVLLQVIGVSVRARAMAMPSWLKQSWR